jgi:sigma-B regulation protein RsbU (phosphoserine phosphatase)
MIPVPIPPDDDERVADLKRLHLALTTPEKVFDGVTRKLARIFEVPAVFLSFTDHDTQYHKSLVAPPELDAGRTESREESICSHVIGNNEMLVVEDLQADERFRDNAHVVDTGARFYAGTPLRADSGRAIGSLCIIDVRPRVMAEREADMLRLIADGVMAQVGVQEASAKLLDRTVKIERDLEQARHVQRFLLPPSLMEGRGWRITHLYQPAADLGGDFLDVQSMPDGRLAIIVADVSGHGTPAALTAAMTKTAFMRAAAHVDTPTAILESINRDLVGIAPPGQFMSAFAATLEPGGSVLEIASAGHPYPLLIRDGRIEPLRHENEVLLLLQSDQEYRSQTTIELTGSDRLLIYTDGAIEAADPDGRMVGVDGLCRYASEVMGSGAGDCLEALWSRLRRHAAGPLNDDLALLCIESMAK